MAGKGLFGSWFCGLVVCVLVWPGLAQVPEPAQCLVSGIYNLVRLPENKDELSCWQNCFAEPDCHMAVVARPLTGQECLLVNCLNQGQHSYLRDPSAEIMVYPKSTSHNAQKDYLQRGAYGLANERLRCFGLMNYSSSKSGDPRFFYNSTSFRCERFYSGCGSNRNTFDTQEGCEALCNEKFRCYRPMQYGGCRSNMTKFFYNQSSRRCERFTFSGCGSNGNIFSTVDECEMLCGDVKDQTATVPTRTTEEPEPEETVGTTSQPAVEKDQTATVPTRTTEEPEPEETVGTTSQPAVEKDPIDTVSEETGTSPSVTSDATALSFVILAIAILVLVAFTGTLVVVIMQHCRRSPSPPPYRSLTAGLLRHTTQ